MPRISYWFLRLSDLCFTHQFNILDASFHLLSINSLYPFWHVSLYTDAIVVLLYALE